MLSCTDKVSFSNQMLFNPLKSNLFGFIELDSFGIVIKADNRTESLLGYTSTELSGKSICQFFKPDKNKKNALSNLEKITKKTFEEQICRKDGSSFLAELSIRVALT